MRRVILFLFLCHAASAVRHSLQYFYTASSGIPDFPEFVSLGMLDGVEMDYYDSNIKKVIPKQDWMAETEGPEYWESETLNSIAAEQTFKANIETAKQRFNQTGGAHILQKMYGCEWDEETGEVNGFNQYGYDGEDFIVFDLKTETWIAPTPQAVITKYKWDHNRAYNVQKKQYHTDICPEWLKKYVNYGRSSLLRTALPSVSLLQKTPSSPVSCHATGFYPDRAMMFWRKDGEDLHDGVEKGEILPNHDGTFQMRADLKSPAPEDWERYECVFQLSGVKEDIIKRLEKRAVKTNWGKPGVRGDGGSSEFPAAVIGAVVGLLLLLVICITGFLLWKRRKNNGFKPANTSASSYSSDDSAKGNDKAPMKDPDTFSFKSDSSSGESAGSNTPLMKR